MSEPFTTLARLASADALPEPHGGYRPIVRALLRELARVHAVRYAALWLPHGPQWTPAVTWRSRRWVQAALPNAIPDPDLLLGTRGVAAIADVTDGGTRYGALVLAHREDPRDRPVGVAPLGETAVCVGLLLRQTRHRAAGLAALAEADRAVRRVGVTQLELSTVQAVERDRLATAVTATPGRQLRAILERTAELEQALRAGSPQATAITGGIRAGLHEMIEQFRSVVHGVYPQVLRAAGVRAALEEVTAALPVPVVFRGDLGRRQGWAVESGLYQAGASTAAALAYAGGAPQVYLDLGRSGEVLAIRAYRAGADPAQIAAALRDDARRLAALGGRLRVEPATRGAATVVDIRLLERLGGDWTEATHTTEPAPGDVGTDASGATVPDLPTGNSARRLLTLLVTSREAPARSTPVRVAADRQDGRGRVVVVGTKAGELVRVLAGMTAPTELPLPVGYQHRQYPRITLDPACGVPPWRPVGLPDWSAARWPDAAAGWARILVEGPVDALRELRLLHHRDRIDADFAVRLRSWTGIADGPPDAVVLTLSGPASTAEAEFVTILRAAGGDGFSPVVIGALDEGTVAMAGSRQWLRSMCDAVVDWGTGPGGDTAVEAALRTWVRVPARVLAARWALRALETCAATGQLDDEFARAVEAAVAGAYEVAELDLLQALQGRRIRLPRGHDEALRLLGAHGADARSRLGLGGDAGSVQVAQAAGRALAFWRTQSLAPDPVPAGRIACRLLVRACERLLVNGAE